MSPILVAVLIILVTMLLMVLAVIGVTAFGARKVKRHYQGSKNWCRGTRVPLR